MRSTLWMLSLVLTGAGCVQPARPTTPDEKLKHDAEQMIKASEGRLAPVYAPLAAQLTRELKLADKAGIGIDIGGGPGTLSVELAKRTKLHWINADINPHFWAHFLRLADRAGVAHRVSAMYADAQAMPFRDNYADVIVSRGSYHFWPDRAKGFGEILRVLKPGGVAYIGRGFPADMPIETARRIRAKQGKSMNYDRKPKADELRKIMADLGVRDYRLHLPAPAGGDDVNYGIWIEFRKREGVR